MVCKDGKCYQGKRLVYKGQNSWRVVILQVAIQIILDTWSDSWKTKFAEIVQLKHESNREQVSVVIFNCQHTVPRKQTTIAKEPTDDHSSILSLSWQAEILTHVLEIKKFIASALMEDIQPCINRDQEPRALSEHHLRQQNAWLTDSSQAQILTN